MTDDERQIQEHNLNAATSIGALCTCGANTLTAGFLGPAPHKADCGVNRLQSWPPRPEPRTSRDARQVVVYEWVMRTFGAANAEVSERVLRLFEEVVELAQAEDIAVARLRDLIDYVYVKPKGDPKQEVGGVGTTLLAYCAAKKISADECEETELHRVLNVDAAHFRERHNKKAAAGVAEPAPEPARAAGPTPYPTPEVAVWYAVLSPDPLRQLSPWRVLVIGGRIAAAAGPAPIGEDWSIVAERWRSWKWTIERLS